MLAHDLAYKRIFRLIMQLIQSRKAYDDYAVEVWLFNRNHLRAEKMFP